MRTTLAQGIRSADDLTTDEKDFRTYKAGGAIPVGSPVMLDVTITTGLEVIVAANGSALSCGVYTGIGGTGAVAGTGFTGRAAVDQDVIQIQTYGVCEALVDGTTDVTAGDPLDSDGTALIKITTPTASMKHYYIAVDAQATDAGTATTIFLNN